MRKVRFFALALAFVAACAVYDKNLLDQPGSTVGGTGAAAAGSSASGGVPSSAGTAPAAAGSSVVGGTGTTGGSPSTGGATPSGGHTGYGVPSDGGAPDPGAAGADGIDDGGASGEGGESVGGTSTGGRGGTGGGGSSSGGSTGGGGTSSGGSTATSGLIDDMQHSAATYSNSPFVGSWSRVTSGDMVWVAADVASMFQKRADSATNRSLRVAAGCPTSGTCAADPSTVEVNVTLSNGAAVDVSAYTGVSFYINRVANTGNILRVAIEDGPAHVGSTTCATGTEADCGKECESVVVPTTPYGVGATPGVWTKYQVPFSSFGKSDGWMHTRQNTLDTKTVYSLGFRVDRNIIVGGTGSGVQKIDFEIDDLSLYK